ncbi:hypothetical protein SK128_019946 [Halocaridina rubra]|uniref:Uncharacterized protein n=1 Tax=Halocaridina rubra TaxID=373956 RepID=A0AAN8WSF9_HALRR
MNDLRGVGQETNHSALDGDRSAFASVNVKALTRSFSDLTRICDSSNSTSPNRQRKEDIRTFSVSVRALRASYGDLPQAVSSSALPPVPRPRTTMTSSRIPRPQQRLSSVNKNSAVQPTPRTSCPPPPAPSTGARNRKLPPTPVKPSEVCSAHARTHATLDSKRNDVSGSLNSSPRTSPLPSGQFVISHKRRIPSPPRKLTVCDRTVANNLTTSINSEKSQCLDTNSESSGVELDSRVSSNTNVNHNSNSISDLSHLNHRTGSQTLSNSVHNMPSGELSYTHMNGYSNSYNTTYSSSNHLNRHSPSVSALQVSANR